MKNIKNKVTKVNIFSKELRYKRPKNSVTIPTIKSIIKTDSKDYRDELYIRENRDLENSL